MINSKKFAFLIFFGKKYLFRLFVLVFQKKKYLKFFFLTRVNKLFITFSKVTQEHAFYNTFISFCWSDRKLLDSFCLFNIKISHFCKKLTYTQKNVLEQLSSNLSIGVKVLESPYRQKRTNLANNSVKVFSQSVNNQPSNNLYTKFHLD